MFDTLRIFKLNNTLIALMLFGQQNSAEPSNKKIDHYATGETLHLEQSDRLSY